VIFFPTFTFLVTFLKTGVDLQEPEALTRSGKRDGAVIVNLMVLVRRPLEGVLGDVWLRRSTCSGETPGLDGAADGGVGVGVVGVAGVGGGVTVGGVVTVGGGVTVGRVASIVKLWVTEVAARKLFVPSWVAVTVQVPTSCKVTVSSEIEQTFLSVDSRAMFPPDVAETNWRRLTVGVDRY
jgi:hypothetical protein